MLPQDMPVASELLYKLWEEGRQIDSLPDNLRPATRAEAYGVQAHIETFSASPLYGWKIAATSPAGQAHIGVGEPMAGRILAERVIENGGSCSLGSNQMRVAELEFAFRIGRTLPISEVPYTVKQVLENVDSLHPAIEIPDSRIREFEKAGEAQLIADNACAHRFLLGAAASVDWRLINLAHHVVRGETGRGLVAEGRGANVLGHPAIALTWLANELSSLGLPLYSGCIVTTGTCIQPMKIEAGDVVRGDFGVLGSVSLSIT